MMHKAWSSIEKVPYCFSRSYVKLQGHTALKIVDFDPNWAFPDCISSLKLPMATKWCTKLEVALKRCPVVFQGHPSNFKVTRAKNRRFESNLSKITRPVVAIKSLRFALFHFNEPYHHSILALHLVDIEGDLSLGYYRRFRKRTYLVLVDTFWMCCQWAAWVGIKWYTSWDLCRIPGLATQAETGLSGTLAEADRPKPICTWQIQPRPG